MILVIMEHESGQIARYMYRDLLNKKHSITVEFIHSYHFKVSLRGGPKNNCMSAFQGVVER